MASHRPSGPRTLVEFLEDAARKYRDRPALLFKTRLAVHAMELQGTSFATPDRLASELQSRGIRKGDRVLIWGPNCPQWVIAFFACLRAGAIAVPLDVRSTADFARNVAGQTDPRLMFASRITPAAHRELGLETIDFEEVESICESRGQPGPVELEPDDLAEIMFTSGTTGDPKGVMLTHRNLLSNLESIRQVIPGEPWYRLVSILPLSHMFEQVGGLLIPLSAGANVTYPLSLKPVTLFKTLAERQGHAAARGAAGAGPCHQGRRARGSPPGQGAGVAPAVEHRAAGPGAHTAPAVRQCAPQVRRQADARRRRWRGAGPGARREVGRDGLQADPGLRRHRGLSGHKLPHDSKPEVRLGRPAAARRGRSDRLGRRDHGARPQPHARLLEGAGADREGLHRRLVPHRRPGLPRRQRLRAHQRPDERHDRAAERPEPVP